MKQFLFSLFKFFKKPATHLFIVSHFYQGNRIQVLFKDRLGKEITHDIQVFNRRRDLVSQFSSKDAFLLGYLLAEDSTVRMLQKDH
ncbi:MAG: hypothetical protein AB7V32_04230 [Candidatus Berkiella sp.]